MAAMLAIIAAAPTGLPNLHPIRRPIAGAGIARRVHEGLHQQRRHAVLGLSIRRQTPQCPGQRGTGQILNVDPGQQQEPAVIDHLR